MLLLFAWLIATHTALSLPCRYTYRIETWQAGGRAISTEIYEPKGGTRHPLLLMIHGTAGVFSRQAGSLPEDDNFGEKTFATHCYVVVLPHYFEAIGRSSITDLDEARRDFPKLRAVLDDILSEAAALRRVRGRPILLYGESFGGYLAVSIGFRDPRVLAVSEFSGGLPGQDIEPQNRFLSLLIQHGAEDKLVPNSAALGLQEYAGARGAKVQIHIYAGQGHYFDAAARMAVLDRTLAFFDEVTAKRARSAQNARPSMRITQSESPAGPEQEKDR
ncbi:MAG: dienelactone hydrolase family protein [Terracidiphilus sp.]